MSTPVRKSVDLSYGKCTYLEQGSGHPVLLLHGAGVTGGADDFRPSLEKLGDGYRFIAPDFINWPPGDPKPHAQAFPMMVDQLREFMDVMKIEKAHVVGATMGGWIAGLLAYESPERVSKVVMTGNPGFHGSPNDRLGTGGIPEYERTRESLGKQLVGLSDAEKDAITKEKIDRLSEPGYLDAYNSMMRTMADHENRKEYNLIRRLPTFKMPTFFLIGRGDPSSEHAEKLQSLVPGSRMHIIETGAHQVHYENQEEFASQILDFFKS
jgi:pimeloyl-ACP methyl ester carboxylesterase